MSLESAKRIWEEEYKPSIQLLIENGETSYRPAMILIFCAIEHAYRAIHEIPENDRCIEDAIRWALPYYSTDEVKQRNDNWHVINERIKREIDRMRESMFNALKHVGIENEGIKIDGSEFGWHSTLIIGDAISGEEERSDTFYIQGLWQTVVKRLDEEYSRKINSGE